MGKRYEIRDTIIEYGIYLYIILMFLSKGEGIRNLIIFISFALWLFSLKHRGNLYLLREPVSKIFWIFGGATLFSVVFSIDPLYSLSEFKSEPRKFMLLFPVIATVMANEKRLKKVIHVSFITSLLIVAIGYYSFIFNDTNMLRPATPLMHVWHNTFAKYLNTLLPVAFILFFIYRKFALKVFLAVSSIFLLFALMLSTSRGGYIAFLSMGAIWSLYFARTRRRNIKKVISVIVVIVLVIGTISWFTFPVVRQRMSVLSVDIYDINGRTVAWKAAIYGFKQKPVFGWGYGKKIFHKDDAFINSPIKKRPLYREAEPFDDPHNMFLTVLFHQGIIGIIPYVLLILLAIKVFWAEALKTTGIKSYMLVACVSVLAGNYIVHSMLTLPRLQDLAVILGLGMAAKGIGEDSHN
jgi:O-antigen ligase